MKAPLKSPYRITSPFGPRVHPISGNRSNHNGVDLVTGRRDEPILAPEAGRITEARKSTAPGGGYGFYVKMLGESGHEHIFAHMKTDSFKVSKGDRVEVGDELGILGATGNVTGPHLHWEVRVSGRPTDPMTHLTTEPTVAPQRPAVAPVAPPRADEWFVYTVQRGDTAWGLSRRFKVSVADIASWNKLKNASVIRVGQKLRIKR